MQSDYVRWCCVTSCLVTDSKEQIYMRVNVAVRVTNRARPMILKKYIALRVSTTPQPVLSALESERGEGPFVVRVN